MGSSTVVYLRLGGNILFLLVHFINIIVMDFAVQRKIVKEDKDLKTFHSLQFKYITIWNLGFQIAHLSMSVISDLSAVMKTDEKYKFINKIRSFKNLYFAGVLWPTTSLVFTIFWPVFSYDRELIFPAFIDKVLTNASNHVIHSMIQLVVIWELVLQPRRSPKTHKWNLINMAVLYVLYFAVILHHYHMTSVWPYPMLYPIYGTIYFPLFAIFVAVLYFSLYFIQWPLTAMIHSTNKAKIR